MEVVPLARVVADLRDHGDIGGVVGGGVAHRNSEVDPGHLGTAAVHLGVLSPLSDVVPGGT